VLKRYLNPSKKVLPMETFSVISGDSAMRCQKDAH
jgi:hypothetical protein